MNQKQYEEDQQLSDLTNSFIFITLLICVCSWAAYRVYHRNQEQQECRDHGGYVEQRPNEHSLLGDEWVCRVEDRD